MGTFFGCIERVRFSKLWQFNIFSVIFRDMINDQGISKVFSKECMLNEPRLKPCTKYILCGRTFSRITNHSPSMRAANDNAEKFSNSYSYFAVFSLLSLPQQPAVKERSKISMTFIIENFYDEILNLHAWKSFLLIRMKTVIKCFKCFNALCLIVWYYKESIWQFTVAMLFHILCGVLS